MHPQAHFSIPRAALIETGNQAHELNVESHPFFVVCFLEDSGRSILACLTNLLMKARDYPENRVPLPEGL
jgi:hypothetical protein